MLLARRYANLAWSYRSIALMGRPREPLRLLRRGPATTSMRANELGFRSRAGAHRRFGEPVGEGQVGQPDSALGRPDEQVGVGCEVGVEAQGGAANHDSDVVAVARRRASSVATSPRSRRSLVGAARLRRTSP